MATAWWIQNEIKDYCRKATEADGTSIYQPLFTKGWRLVVKPKPGHKFPTKSQDFAHPYLLLKAVQFNTIASRLYPSEPIGMFPERLAKVLDEFEAMAARMSDIEKEWEGLVKDWKP